MNENHFLVGPVLGAPSLPIIRQNQQSSSSDSKPKMPSTSGRKPMLGSAAIKSGSSRLTVSSHVVVEHNVGRETDESSSDELLDYERHAPGSEAPIDRNIPSSPSLNSEDQDLCLLEVESMFSQRSEYRSRIVEHNVGRETDESSSDELLDYERHAPDSEAPIDRNIPSSPSLNSEDQDLCLLEVESMFSQRSEYRSRIVEHNVGRETDESSSDELLDYERHAPDSEAPIDRNIPSSPSLNSEDQDLCLLEVESMFSQRSEYRSRIVEHNVGRETDESSSDELLDYERHAPDSEAPIDRNIPSSPSLNSEDQDLCSLEVESMFSQRSERVSVSTYHAVSNLCTRITEFGTVEQEETHYSIYQEIQSHCLGPSSTESNQSTAQRSPWSTNATTQDRDRYRSYSVNPGTSGYQSNVCPNQQPTDDMDCPSTSGIQFKPQRVPKGQSTTYQNSSKSRVPRQKQSNVVPRQQTSRTTTQPTNTDDISNPSTSGIQAKYQCKPKKNSTTTDILGVHKQKYKLRSSAKKAEKPFVYSPVLPQIKSGITDVSKRESQNDKGIKSKLTLERYKQPAKTCTKRVSSPLFKHENKTAKQQLTVPEEYTRKKSKIGGANTLLPGRAVQRRKQ